MSLGPNRNACLPIRTVAGSDVFVVSPAFADPLSDLESLRKAFQSGEIVQAGGRGAARVVDLDGRLFLVRPYRRGGLPGRIIKDSFLYLGEKNIRGVKEFHLLCDLRKSGFPVPKPALVTYARARLIYRCSIMLEYIPAVRPLAEVFLELSDERWHQLGVLIRQFHQAGVYHSDLNAYNILVGDEGFYLIDFDKCYIIPRLIKPVCGWWLRRNIKRLCRSLVKHGFQKGERSHRAWEKLLQGYGML